jgi:phosphopentomutase
MPRAILIVLDSVGCGFAPDAARFGDEGANTLGSIAGSHPLKLPNLSKLGLGLACATAGGAVPHGLECAKPTALYGSAIETSQGKDTPSGHWEMVGAPALTPFGYFSNTQPCFPENLTRAMIAQGNIAGLLGNKHASGTDILDELGGEHIATQKPIAYSSIDSVLQIAAHEDAFGLERLYALCELTRKLVDPLNICRVIARPFTGNAQTGFSRTSNRKDYAMQPPEGGLLGKVKHVVSLGKIGDILAHQNTGREVKAAGNMALFDKLLQEVPALPNGGLIFANFVDFDTEYGHRRDVAGYAKCLETFDARLPELLNLLQEGDCLIITADHGNDPTFKGTDHTREQVPVLCVRGNQHGCIGQRQTFADIGASIAMHLGLTIELGKSFIAV